MKKTIHTGLMLGSMAAAVIIVLDSSTVAVSFASDNDPRSDQACKNMLDLQGKQDARTEPDSELPDSDQGAQKAREGSVKALGDCPVG